MGSGCGVGGATYLNGRGNNPPGEKTNSLSAGGVTGVAEEMEVRSTSMVVSSSPMCTSVVVVDVDLVGIGLGADLGLGGVDAGAAGRIGVVVDDGGAAAGVGFEDVAVGFVADSSHQIPRLFFWTSRDTSVKNSSVGP